MEEFCSKCCKSANLSSSAIRIRKGSVVYSIPIGERKRLESRGWNSRINDGGFLFCKCSSFFFLFFSEIRFARLAPIGSPLKNKRGCARCSDAFPFALKRSKTGETECERCIFDSSLDNSFHREFLSKREGMDRPKDSKIIRGEIFLRKKEVEVEILVRCWSRSGNPCNSKDKTGDEKFILGDKLLYLSQKYKTFLYHRG